MSNAERFNKYFARLRAIGTSVNNDIANMKKGMSLGIVVPAFIMNFQIIASDGKHYQQKSASQFSFQQWRRGKTLLRSRENHFKMS
ncbi:MAG: hypothetical protein IPL67_19325 [Ignavibacteria bacterium]|nr:hypothetical protein [Ignavibacteria bacterium]